MSARLGTVVQVEQVPKDVPTVEVQVEIGDESITAELLLGPGCDAMPLPGDEVLLSEGEGTGEMYAMAFGDSKNAGTAENGEHRIFARDTDGAVVCEVWCKKDGTVSIKTLKGDAAFEIKPDGGLNYNNGAFICDKQGNAKFAGEVTAMAGTPEAPLPGTKVSTHTHPTGVGPSGPPTPGT